MRQLAKFGGHTRELVRAAALRVGPTSMRKLLSRPEQHDHGTTQTSIYERPFVKRGVADSVWQASRTSPSPSASVDVTGARWPDLVRWQFVGATSCELATTQYRTSRLNGKWRVSHSAVAHRARTSSGSAVGTNQHGLSLGAETNRLWSVSTRCALLLRPLSAAGWACHAMVKNFAGFSRRPSRSMIGSHMCLQRQHSKGRR